jgi:hypothetical protein
MPSIALVLSDWVLRGCAKGAAASGSISGYTGGSMCGVGYVPEVPYKLSGCFHSFDDVLFEREAAVKPDS